MFFFRFFKGSKLYIKTLHPIQSGDEISENYGPTFYLKPKNSRKTELQGRYWFQCTCKPCSQNWPLLENLQVIGNGEKLKTVDELLSKGNVRDSIVELSRMIESFYRKDEIPTQNSIRAEDKLRTSISNLGSVSVAEKKSATKS